MTKEKKELFTEKVTAGSRTYFFDVKESKDGTRYLVISESRQKVSHHRLMIFQEHLEAFNEGYGKAMQFLGGRSKRWRSAIRLLGGKAVRFLGARSKACSLDEKRAKHPKAYERWTSEDDQRLSEKFITGSSVSELAQFFQRQESAIRSRLTKLGILSRDR